MNGLISVIVPVFNVAVYLPECIESILGQDYEKLEVILIDDGSNDTSGSICDEYAARDNRIHVIHQKNGGAAAAKNAGLRVATGEFLSFVDSDDFLEPGAYSHMVKLLTEYDADVVQCAFRDVYRDSAVDRIVKHGRKELERNNYLVSFTQDWTCGLMTDKLFRRSLFSGIYFEVGNKIDDEYFTYQGIMNANKILCDDQIIYNYRKRRSSVMYSPESGQRILLDRIDYTSKRRLKIISRFPELRRVFDEHFMESMIYLSWEKNCSPECLARIRAELKTYFRERGHTVPKIGNWWELVKLYFGRSQNLSSPSCETVSTGATDNFFD